MSFGSSEITTFTSAGIAGRRGEWTLAGFAVHRRPAATMNASDLKDTSASASAKFFKGGPYRARVHHNKRLEPHVRPTQTPPGRLWLLHPANGLWVRLASLTLHISTAEPAPRPVIGIVAAHRPRPYVGKTRTRC